MREALLQEQGVTAAAKNNKSWRRLLPLLLLLLIPAVYIFLDKDNISDKAFISNEKNNQNNVINSSTDKNGNSYHKRDNSNTKQSVKTLQHPVTKEQTPNTNNISDPEIKPLSYNPLAKQSSGDKDNIDEVEPVNLKK